MRLKAVCTIALVLCGVTGLGAQTEDWGLGMHLVVSLPQEGFDNISRDGEGIGGKAFYRLNPYLSLRADLAYLSYGERRNSEWTTTNAYIFVTRRYESIQLTLGPQFTYRVGRVTPYAAALGGFYHYHAVTTAEDLLGYSYPYQDYSGSQGKWGWSAAGGLLVDLGIGAHLDFGFKLQNIGDVETTVDKRTTRQTGVDFVITLGAVFFRH